MMMNTLLVGVSVRNQGEITLSERLNCRFLRTSYTPQKQSYNAISLASVGDYYI